MDNNSNWIIFSIRESLALIWQSHEIRRSLVKSSRKAFQNEKSCKENETYFLDADWSVSEWSSEAINIKLFLYLLSVLASSCDTQHKRVKQMENFSFPRRLKQIEGSVSRRPQSKWKHTALSIILRFARLLLHRTATTENKISMEKPLPEKKRSKLASIFLFVSSLGVVSLISSGKICSSYFYFFFISLKQQNCYFFCILWSLLQKMYVVFEVPFIFSTIISEAKEISRNEDNKTSRIAIKNKHLCLAKAKRADTWDKNLGDNHFLFIMKSSPSTRIFADGN